MRGPMRLWRLFAQPSDDRRVLLVDRRADLTSFDHLWINTNSLRTQVLFEIPWAARRWLVGPRAVASSSTCPVFVAHDLSASFLF